jgi:hypothetical protein
MERRATMLIYVPQSYIALVYAGGELRAVLEAGVGFVPHSEGLRVQYVYLQPQPQVPYFEDEEEAVETVQPETVH